MGAFGNPLCFTDVESTGLDPRIHQPYEVCFWRDDKPNPATLDVPHSLDLADGTALEIGGYFERAFSPWLDTDGQVQRALIKSFTGVTLVGSNPAFDAAMLTRVIGYAPWHHRHINVADVAMTVFDWDRPRGLHDVAAACVVAGHEIPTPDHTAEGDVRTTRAVYYALRQLRKELHT